MKKVKRIRYYLHSNGRESLYLYDRERANRAIRLYRYWKDNPKHNVSAPKHSVWVGKLRT